jgi:hypothetical protein
MCLFGGKISVIILPARSVITIRYITVACLENHEPAKARAHIDAFWIIQEFGYHMSACYIWLTCFEASRRS